MPTPNLIQRADLNQRLTRALEIKGQKSPVLQLDSSVVAVVIAEDLTKQAEWLTPTERKLAVTTTTLATVGQNGIVVVQNPLGSGVVVIIERISVRVGATTAWKFGLCDPLAVPATPVLPLFRDRRNSGVPETRAFSGTDAVLRIVAEYMNVQSSNSIATPWYDTEGIVVQPGDTFGIQTVLPNVEFSPTIWCEEIPVR